MTSYTCDALFNLLLTLREKQSLSKDTGAQVFGTNLTRHRWPLKSNYLFYAATKGITHQRNSLVSNRVGSGPEAVVIFNSAFASRFLCQYSSCIRPSLSLMTSLNGQTTVVSPASPSIFYNIVSLFSFIPFIQFQLNNKRQVQNRLTTITTHRPLSTAKTTICCESEPLVNSELL